MVIHKCAYDVRIEKLGGGCGRDRLWGGAFPNYRTVPKTYVCHSCLLEKIPEMSLGGCSGPVCNWNQSDWSHPHHVHSCMTCACFLKQVKWCVFTKCIPESTAADYATIHSPIPTSSSAVCNNCGYSGQYTDSQGDGYVEAGHHFCFLSMVMNFCCILQDPVY